MLDAEHQETAPDASIPLISKLTCSLVDVTQTVRLTPGSLSFRAYGKEEVAERFRCSYGLNPAYRDSIGKGELRVAGLDADGEVRIVELPRHRFFIATLFLPQLSSSFDRPHHLITSYLRAALAFRDFRQRGEVSI